VQGEDAIVGQFHEIHHHRFAGHKMYWNSIGAERVKDDEIVIMIRSLCQFESGISKDHPEISAPLLRRFIIGKIA
jgi:hypothetical protein